MTTIAYDGRFLAADTKGTYGNDGICQAVCHKLRVEDGVAFAATGRITADWLTALINWWQCGRRPDCMPYRGSDEEVGNFIIVNQSGALSLTYGTPYPQDMGKPVAWGSGANYAIGAMEMGADAMRAVQVSMKHDSPTGGDIEFIDLEDIERGVQVWHPETDTASPADVWRTVIPFTEPPMTATQRVIAEEMKKYCGYEEPKPEPLVISGYMDILDGYRNIKGKAAAVHFVDAGHDENSLQFVYRELRTGPCSAERHATTQLRDLIADYLRSVAAPLGTTIAWRILPEVAEYAGKWKGYARLAILYTAETPVAKGITIYKPRKLKKHVMDAATGKSTGDVVEAWTNECTGRLVLGTGCGHCLRCNREWFALLRQMPQPQDIHVKSITLTGEQLTQSIASLTMSGKAMPVGDGVALTCAEHPGWPHGLGVEAPGGVVNRSDRAMLEEWVLKWNAASVRANMYEVGRLEQQLRKMTFPDGAELITEYDESVSGWQRRIIYGETEIS